MSPMGLRSSEFDHLTLNAESFNMAEEARKISVYVEKFRLINEPQNHWEARKEFLVRNWDDYPEMQLVSLSMVWANMQFDGCKYSPELMDRVQDMAAGCSAQPSKTTSRSASQVRPQELANLQAAPERMQEHHPSNEKHLDSCATNQHPILMNDSMVKSKERESKSQGDLSAKNVSGDDITISKDTPLVSLYPPDGNEKFVKLVQLCSKIKERAVKGKTDKQIMTMLWTLLSQPDVHNRYGYQSVKEDKKIQSWKTYFMIDETLCTTCVASSKKVGKETAIMLWIKLVKEHNVIVLQESSRKEGSELGFISEMVYMNDRPPQGRMASTTQDPFQEQNEDLDITLAESEIQIDDRKGITAESILKSLPHQFATHGLNCSVSPAPKLPEFVLYESREDQAKLGYLNPVATIVNSCSMCKVPYEFALKRCEISQGIEGIVCVVFICHQNIATGLALGNREAKHLAAHHAVQALKMTNPVLVKTASADSTSVTRDELTDGSVVSEEMLPDTNVGHKLLKMMGWKGEGAGLGKREDGIANPVKATGSGSRSKTGLGCDMTTLRNPTTKQLDDRKALEYLQDFARSDREDELVFTSELSTDERKRLHNIALKLGLKSKSRGKGDSRYLTIGRKWSVGNLVQAVEKKGGSMGGYELLGPPL